MTGRIRALFASYGFVRDDDTDLDFFVHQDDVVGAVDFEHLAVGDAVTFEAVEPTPPKGRRAREVAWKEGKRADG